MTNTGWICPRCQNVYAPFWFSCEKCNKEPKKHPLNEFIGKWKHDPDCPSLKGELCNCMLEKEECDWPKLHDECEHGINTKQNECLSCKENKCEHDWLRVWFDNTGISPSKLKCQKCGAIE